MTPKRIADSTDLRRIHDEELAVGPFPSDECAAAHITGELHGHLTLYLSDIAGLASRGKRLALVAEPEKSAFLRLALRNLYSRCPGLLGKITAARTPRLYALVDATEQARQLIVEVLSP